jgi:methylated-DNA-[protein]-cysteine S-methyltransferase
MTTYYQTFPTPVGPFSLAINSDGALLATAFGDLSILQTRATADVWELDAARTQPVRTQVEEYFAGKRQRFDLSLAPTGTEYQKQVWAALSEIPFGTTQSYAQVAATIQSGARAVGNANGANPIALIVPCHRVIGANGSLTGFAFGQPIKQRLLELEGVWPKELPLAHAGSPPH